MKLKVGGGETDKRQIDYLAEDRERITPEADGGWSSIARATSTPAGSAPAP